MNQTQSLTALDVVTSQQTMSSREIAELTNSTHDNVLKTVRALVARGVVFQNETLYTHPQNGQQYPEFLLNYRDSMVVVSGYSPELRAKIIDRWQELEAKQAAPAFAIPATFSQALLLAAQQAEQIEKQQAALALAAPKVAFVDSYVEAAGLKGFRETAKLLKANEARFRNFLTEQKIMYRLGGEWMAYQPHIDAGRFMVKAGKSPQNNHAYSRCLFTPKGLQWVACEWAKFAMVQGGKA